VRYAPTLTPPDDDEDDSDQARSERIAAAEGANNLRSIERLHDRLLTNRHKLVRSLAARFDPATLASLATVTLALISTTEELRKGSSKSI
jgi:hypothetical protein